MRWILAGLATLLMATWTWACCRAAMLVDDLKREVDYQKVEGLQAEAIKEHINEVLEEVR